jgi:hypothetical protein
MKRSIRFTLLSLAIALAAPAVALAADAKKDAAPPAMTPEQKMAMDAMAKAGTPGEAHAQLAKMTGSYDLEIKSWEKPGGEAMVEQGTATRSMALGGRVMVEMVQSKMMGQPFEGHGMHGYDNVTGKHWATWNDSMSTGVMIEEGDCDAAGACSLTGTWSDPITKRKATAHMKTRWTDANTQVFEMNAPGPDGKEFKMMEITYKKRP